MKNKKKTILIAGIAALVLVAGVLTYFSKTMSIDNPFTTKEYGGETIEKFTPEGDWEPGEQVSKEVQVDNTGDYDLFVRVKFSEEWKRDGNIINGTTLDSSVAGFFPADATAAVPGGSSVYKELLNTGDWQKGSDGWYYYKKTLAAGESSSKLLGSVTLCGNANMGEYTDKMLYAVVDEGVEAKDVPDSDYQELASAPVPGPGKVLYQKKVTTLNPNNKGLAGANYTLTVITEIAQADPAAVTGWETYPGN